MERNVDLGVLRKKLEEEKKKLERELSGLGKKNPDNPKDWIATPPDLNNSTADKNEAADQIEEFEGTMATETELEKQLNDVNAALLHMDTGNYGVCEIGGEPIEADRLSANPSARTCKKHLG